jgi:uncharacterized protein (DUF1778 family)
MATGARAAQLSFRLSPELKNVIEEAAAIQGQSVSEFAISTLVQQARTVIEHRNVTVLGDQDRERFIALLDNANAKPNPALVKAAKRYRKHLG